MASALEILKKLESINVDLSAQVAIENTAQAATDTQRGQLSQGMTSSGAFLPDYSFRSVFQYGKPPGPIKLYDTGSFYRGVLIDVRQDIFIMESADEKSRMLQDRYGENILGLGMQAKIEYIRTLQPEFLKQIKSYLQ
jgi:hypothetical protein